MGQTKYNFQTGRQPLYLSVVIVVLSVVASFQIRPAFAEYDQGQDFGPALAESFNELMGGLRETKCVGAIYGQSLDLTFVGLTPHNIHLSKNRRHHINSVAQHCMRKRYGQIYNISAAQNIATIANFSYSKPEDLAKTAKHFMQGAPLLLLMRTIQRPFLDVIQLEIMIFARSKGISLCNRKKSIYLHLPSNRVISLQQLNAMENGAEGEYLNESRGYLFGLKKIMHELQGIKTLPLLPNFDDKTRCNWHNREIRLFQSQYFALQQELSKDLNYRREHWPLLKNLSPQYGDQSDILPDPAPNALLALRWSRIENRPRIIQFTLSLYEKAGLKNTVSYFIVANNARYHACQPIKKIVKHKSLKLTVGTRKRHYKIGDKLDFTVSANRDCELNIFYEQADGQRDVLPYYVKNKPFIGDSYLKAGEVRKIPSDPGLTMTISAPTGAERLFVQCKVGGLGNTRMDQNFLDLLRQGKASLSAIKNAPSEKDNYDFKAIEFFTEK